MHLLTSWQLAWIKNEVREMLCYIFEDYVVIFLTSDAFHISLALQYECYPK